MALFGKPALRYSGTEAMTVIGPEAVFHGSITARGSVRVEGEMEGHITDAVDVVVGRGGRVRGNISAERVEVAGEVTGDVTTSVRLELKGASKLLGNIRPTKLAIEEGAVFEGSCTMAEGAETLAGS